MTRNKISAMNCRFGLLVISVLLNTCAGDIEGDADCPRDCSNSINATPMMKFTNLTEAVGLDCRGVPEGHQTTVEAIFQVSGQGAGGEEGDLPKASIAIRPVMPQICISSEGENASDEEYRCIQTPKDEWCSNECGLISIKFMLACAGGGATRTSSLHLASGGQVSKEVKITLQYEEEKDSGGE